MLGQVLPHFLAPVLTVNKASQWKGINCCSSRKKKKKVSEAPQDVPVATEEADPCALLSWMFTPQKCSLPWCPSSGSCTSFCPPAAAGFSTRQKMYMTAKYSETGSRTVNASSCREQQREDCNLSRSHLILRQVSRLPLATGSQFLPHRLAFHGAAKAS